MHNEWRSFIWKNRIQMGNRLFSVVGQQHEFVGIIGIYGTFWTHSFYILV